MADFTSSGEATVERISAVCKQSEDFKKVGDDVQAKVICLHD